MKSEVGIRKSETRLLSAWGMGHGAGGRGKMNSEGGIRNSEVESRYAACGEFPQLSGTGAFRRVGEAEFLVGWALPTNLFRPYPSTKEFGAE